MLSNATQTIENYQKASNPLPVTNPLVTAQEIENPS